MAKRESKSKKKVSGRTTVTRSYEPAKAVDADETPAMGTPKVDLEDMPKAAPKIEPRPVPKVEPKPVPKIPGRPKGAPAPEDVVSEYDTKTHHIYKLKKTHRKIVIPKTS